MQFLKEKLNLMYGNKVSHGGRGLANKMYSIRRGCFKDLCETQQVHRSLQVA